MSHARQPTLCAAVVPLLLAMAGCASTPSPNAQANTATSDPPAASSGRSAAPYQTVHAAERDLYTQRSVTTQTPVMRTSRYQLVTLDPNAGQRHLLQQIVKIDLPDSLNLTVAGGMRHVLARSGLRLCNSARGDGRFSTPLPVVDHHLGPTTLGDALQVLAGPAWRMTTNDATRQVCFQRRTASKPATPNRGSLRTALADNHRE